MSRSGSRTPMALRDGTLDDVPFLLGVWRDSLRLAAADDQHGDLEQIVLAAQDSPRQRVVIAEFDGERAGAVFLHATSMSPLNLEPTLQVLAPHVEPDFQRRGIGHALMEAAVSFAEELGIGHVAAAAAWGSRDGNRYLARLGFGPQGVYRAALTATVRAKLNAQSRSAARPRDHLGRVLAARRSARRSTAV